MQQLLTLNDELDEEYNDGQAIDYKRLLIDFADRIGHLDELENYLHDEVLQEDFPTVDFNDLKFKIN